MKRSAVKLFSLAVLVTGLALPDVAAQRRVRRSFYESNPVLTDRSIVKWPTASPSKVGLDPAKLDAGTKQLASHPRARAFLVVRSGSLAWERYFHGAGPQESRNVHSASKSLLGALVGIAIKEGKLTGVDHLVAKAFGDLLPAAPDPRRKLTVEHLLTMTTGLSWREDVTEHWIERRSNWVRAILRRRSVDPPGTKFHYSTGATHVLSALLTKSTGEATHVYARKNLLEPLGITVDRWGCHDPQGYDSGGCNVYLTPRELARFGQLFAQRGKWKDRQLVPAKWIEESWRPHQKVDRRRSYGYLWWLFREGDHQVALAWGYGGQFVLVIPDLDLVAVVATDTEGGFSGPKLDPIALARDVLVKAVVPK